MRMMIDDCRILTKTTIGTEIVERLGEDTRFYTCSAENMTADELVVFLESRSKFIHEVSDGFRTELDKMCKV
jgi:probable metal-binding protein